MPKPKDRHWQARKERLFPDGRIQISPYDSLDQFIGRLRELEDGMDPHAPRRSHPAEEIFVKMSNGDWRDERDLALWHHWSTNAFFLDPDGDVPEKMPVTPQLGKILPLSEWSSMFADALLSNKKRREAKSDDK